MRGLAHRIVHARMFEYLLAALIIGSAVLLGMGTSDYLYDRFNIWMGLFLILTLVLLILEVLLKVFALAPRVDRYFMDPWNVFDFLAISFLIISMIVYPAVSYYGILIIMVRLLRLLRGLSTIQGLRLVLSALIRSIPSVGHIVLLLGIILYGYALVGNRTFGEYDPEQWGSLGVSALSLIQIVTLDDWTKVMHSAIDVQPLAWIYFVSFATISAFVVANIFVAIILENWDKARAVRPEPSETPALKEEILQELHSTRQALHRLEERLQQLPD